MKTLKIILLLLLIATPAMAGNNYPVQTYSIKCAAIGSDTTPDYDVSALGGNSCFTDTIDTGATTPTFSNPAPSGHLSSFTLILTNAGSQTINWPAAVDWPGGTAPTLTAAGVDVIECSTVDAGTTWLCFAAGLDMQ